MARRVVLTALVAVLAAGSWLRLDGLRWDAAPRVDASGRTVLDEQHLHPDERFLTMVTSALAAPESWRGYFDTAASPLNPHNRGFDFFAYGTLPVFATRALAATVGHADYGRVHLVGRLLSAACSVLTILLAYLLARRLHGRRVALLAALLLALAALPVQQAHFYTVDAMADTLAAAALLAAVGIQRRGAARDYAAFGLAVGAAMACKLNLVVLAPLAVVAAAGGAWTAERPVGRRGLARALRLLALSGLAAFALFRLAQPYAFAGPGPLGLRLDPGWWQDVQEVRELVSGARDIPPGHQWAGRTRLWFPWKNMVLWGMGPALGLAAWLGWALAGVELFRRGRREHLVPWAFVLLLFGYQGSHWVASMRYFLPLYAPLCVFAAWLLVRSWRWAAQARLPSGGRRRLLAAAALLIVAGSTAAWAWAFTSVYRRPHSRIRASRWLYANVPPGAAIANEVWDDALPLRLDGRDAFSIYRGVELHNYAEDTPEKLDDTIARLGSSDVLVLSSNRLYDSIPRLPMRYPMMVRYYRHLFAGELGFEKVAEFTSYPRLLGIEFPDQAAEEAWSVYDHPRVQVFVRTAAWDPERARRLLTPPSWEDIERLTPRDARGFRDLMMDPALAAAQRRGGTWRRAEPDPAGGLFDPDDLANRHPVLAWVLAVALLGLAAFPLCFVAFRGLRDRGWLLARTVGLLAVALVAWLGASLRWWPFAPATAWAALLALAAGSAAIAWRQRREVARFLRERWRLLAAGELLFWGAFALLLWCRWQNPDLWHAYRGGEKPMDLAYLQAVVKSTWFPPYDPWFAGGYLNYYYFGFVLAAVPVLLTGVVPTVAYNLLVPTFFALTAAAAFTVSASLVAAIAAERGSPGLAARAGRWGLAGAAFVVLAGNLTEVGLLARGLRAIGAGDLPSRVPVLGPAVDAAAGLVRLLRGQAALPFPGDWWFWNASRAIPHPPGEPPAITEFPFFTFLFADLHAHLMAMPVALLVLALAVETVRRRNDGDGERPPTRGGEALLLALLAVATGSLWAINAWDAPTALAVAGVALLLRETGRRGWGRAAFGAAAWRLAAVAAAGRLVLLPFHQHFATAYGRPAPWSGSTTPVGAYLAIHGLFLFALGSWIWSDLELSRRLGGGARLLRARWRWRGRRRDLAARLAAAARRDPAHRRVVRVLLLAVAAAAFAALVGGPLQALLLVAGAAGALTLHRHRHRPATALLAALTLAGLALSGAVEHLVLAGDIGRMNTVFKVYLQIWLLWGTAAAVALALVAEAASAATTGAASRPRPRPRAPARRLGAAALAALLAAAALYPALAIPARLRDRFDPAAGPGLDGERFLAAAVYGDPNGSIPLGGDAAAFRWLRHEVAGNPVVLEASVPPYRWGSRVSTFTGLPTVLGWDWHQRQQRSVRRSDPVGRRLRDIATIYSAADVAEVLPLLDRYGVELIYVGPVERAYHPAAGLQKFARSPHRFRKLYDHDGVQIYRRERAAPAPAAAGRLP